MSVTLVLGAGGAVGHAWHAGALAALRDVGEWDARQAELIIGTSAGSLVGALLRAGIGPADLHARATGDPLSAEARRTLTAAGMAAPPGPPPLPRRGPRRGPASPRLLLHAARAPWRLRPGVLAAGALPRGSVDPGIAATVGALHREGWPSRPLWICAVRLTDGRRTVFGRDSSSPPAGVGDAVAASCAIPGWFAPVSIGGEDFVDGGAHSPTNADLAWGSGTDLVIVSSPMSLDRASLRRPAVDRVLRIGHRATLGREVAALRRRGAQVVTLQPGPDDLAVMGGTAAAMDPGRRAVVSETARRTVRHRLESPRLREVVGRLG